LKNFKNKNCLITGAASGIGRATAIEIAKSGVNLFLTDINKKGLEETAGIIKNKGGNVCKFKALDISNFEEVKTFADEVHNEFGAMDIIMNIAGISIWGEIQNLKHEHWQKCINVDLWGPIHIIECFLKETIIASKGGHLVNVSSAAGLFGLPIHSPYSTAKAGLVGLSEVLRFDLQRYNIGVTLVCPGAVNTPMTDSVQIIGLDRNSPFGQELYNKFIKRAIPPERVAKQIIKAIKKKKYLVLTSFDMKFLYWLKRRMPIFYRLFMKKLNKLVDKIKQEQV